MRCEHVSCKLYERNAMDDGLTLTTINITRILEPDRVFCCIRLWSDMLVPI